MFNTRFTGLFASVLPALLLALTSCQEDPEDGKLPKPLGIGTVIEPGIYEAWDIEIPPSGRGLPDGFGTVAKGKNIFSRRCAGCHTFGEENTRDIPVLAGGQGSLDSPLPLLTVGSYWPYATSVFSYIRKAMPFPEPGSLSDDEVYSVLAHILHENKLWPPEGKNPDEPLNRESILKIEMPNRKGFSEPDPRPDTDNVACMVNCPPLPGEGGAGPLHGPVARAVPPISQPAPHTEKPIPRKPVELPFDVELVAVEMGIEQGLHSFSSAVVPKGKDHAGSWLILGGRTNGLHRSGRRGKRPGASFPHASRNDRLWSVDPSGKIVQSVDLKALPVFLQDALSSSNQVSTQVGDVLWVLGGYGWNSQADPKEYGTFGLLIAVKVSDLVKLIFEQNEEQIPSCFSHGTTEDGCRFFGSGTAEGDFRLNITGGGLETIGENEDLVVVLGQRFGGEYTHTSPDALPFFQQFYACRILSFPRPRPRWGGAFTIDGDSIVTIAEGGENCAPGHSGNPNDPFHRRDLNVEPFIYREAPDGGEKDGIAIYGGVFSQNMGGFTQPIYVTENGALLAENAAQLVSQYEAASFGVYDANTGIMHTAILGGMGVNYCTASDGDPTTPQGIETVFVQPPAFTGDGTILSWQHPRREFKQALLYKPYLQKPHGEAPPLKIDDLVIDGGLLGTNARFLADPGVESYRNGVIKLSALAGNKPTRIGHIFGGIATDGEAPRNVFFNSGPSAASNLVFEVWVRPR